FKAPWVALALLVVAIVGGIATFALTRSETGAAAGPGTIVVESTPPGAAIWVDGERRPERTPATLEGLPVGVTYSVKLTHDGFAPHTEEVALSEAEPNAELKVALRRPTASDFAVIRVRTIPAGAQVLLNGRDTGLTTPAMVPEVLPGQAHTLALALEGYVTRSEQITLEAGQVAELSFELERMPLQSGESIVRIVTEPEDARVQIDGRWHESGSPYEFRLPT